MSTPFLGEIRATSFNFAPKGWALCNGQLLAINQNQALFAILGTTYGGNGINNFALPNLQGRTPLHFGGDTVLGQSGGAQSVTLNPSQLPAHQHALQASADLATSNQAANNVPASKPRGGLNVYAPAGSPTTALDPSTLSAAGGSQAHDNMQPYLTINFIIALQGIFPSQN